MSSDANNTLTEAFLGLAADARKVFLTDLNFDLSTMARDSYGEREQPGLWKARHRARAFNELIQQISKQLLASLAPAVAAYPDDAFMQRLIEEATRGQCLDDHLIWSVQHCLKRARSCAA